MPVLAAMDGSASDRPVAREAAATARRSGAPLVLVHVSPWGATEGGSGSVTGRLRAANELAVRGIAAEVAGSPGTGGELEVQCDIRSGDPVAALLEAATGARVLVAGSHPRAQLGRWLLGSVSTDLVDRCPVPLLAVPTATGPVVVDRPGDVVVGVDGRPDTDTDTVLRQAFTEAADRGAGLLAVHTWQDPDDTSVWQHPQGPLRDEDAWSDETRLLGECLAGCRGDFPDVEVREAVVRGPVAPSLAAAALTAQLLVLGRRPAPGCGGPVRHAVLQRAACPVLLVPVG